MGASVRLAVTSIASSIFPSAAGALSMVTKTASMATTAAATSKEASSRAACSVRSATCCKTPNDRA